MRNKIIAACLVAVCLVAGEGCARQAENAADSQADIPVFAADITDREYIVIGDVRVPVHTSLWGGTPTQRATFGRLWDQARSRGADAVIHAAIRKKPDGSSEAVGTAVRFKPPCRQTSPDQPVC
jgi:hypothetical protein